jgi:hypothetical protein
MAQSVVDAGVSRYFCKSPCIRYLQKRTLTRHSYTAVIVTAGYLFHRENKRSLKGGRCDGGPCPRNGFGNVDFRKSTIYFLILHLARESAQL